MENMTIGLSTAFIGISIVFSVLVLLALILTAFKKIFSDKKADTATATGQRIEPQTTENPNEPIVNPSTTNDDELIAVITAAVACAMNRSDDKIIVRSIRKFSSSTWRETALREDMR